MLFPIPTTEKKKAVQYLIDNISQETWDDVAKDMKKNGSNWWIVHHHGFGMDIRNLLREGEFEWGPIEQDEVWVELVEKAVKKKFGKAGLTK